MTKFIAIALLSVFYISAKAQQCNCDLLVNPAYFGKVALYKKPGGVASRSVKNDSLQEDFLSVTINGDSLGYFHAKLTYSMARKSYTGWIKKERYLGTYSRNYNPNKKLSLYASADKGSKVIQTATEVTFCPVTKCNRKWVYTTLPNKLSGWLAPDMQCANAYTTCN